MITLICTKCKATLEMDEAFAGGVCRCQYCGTIQTVPSHLKQASRGAAVGAGQKALYSTKAAAGAGLPSSGLDELANVVASSGLASGLANRTATRPDYAQPAPKQHPQRLPLMIGVGGVVALLIGVIIYLLVSRTSTPPVAPPQQNNTAGPVDTPSQRRGSANVADTGPNFLGIPIEGSKVVYLLDRGDSARDVLDPLKAALLDSLASLGADREFQVLFWTPPSSATEKPDVNEYAYPKSGLAKANQVRVEECRRRFEDLTTSGRTDVGPVMAEAMKRNPEVIFIATAKGINLDDTMLKQVQKFRGNNPVIVHTIDLTDHEEAQGILRAVAEKCGGTYKHVPSHILHGR